MDNGKGTLTDPRGPGDGIGLVVDLTPGATACVRLRTPEECRAAGLDWRTAPWVWSVVMPGGSERLYPASATLVVSEASDTPDSM